MNFKNRAVRSRDMSFLTIVLTSMGGKETRKKEKKEKKKKKKKKKREKEKKGKREKE